MLNIDDYLLKYKRRIPNILLIWFIILIFIIVFLLIINKTINFDDYYQTEGIVKDKSLSIYVLVEDLNKITNNNTLYIDNIQYNYDVKEISSETNNYGSNLYKEVLLDVDLKDKEFIDNNVIKVRFIVVKKTIFKYMIDLIKGE